MGLHRNGRATNPGIEIRWEWREKRRIDPPQLTRQHRQLARQNRPPQRRLVVYSAEHDGLDPV
jgi:hypothetical protein